MQKLKKLIEITKAKKKKISFGFKSTEDSQLRCLAQLLPFLKACDLKFYQMIPAETPCANIVHVIMMNHAQIVPGIMHTDTCT